MPLDGVPRNVILAAHGSRDPRSARTIAAITRACAVMAPETTVTCAFLDFDRPSLGSALRAAPGPSLIVPLLLTPAYHARIDIPAVVEHARSDGADVMIAEPLGRPDAVCGLAAALDRRLGRARYDAVVVAGAGSRDRSALGIVSAVAGELSRRRGVPVGTGFASGTGPPVADAVTAQLRAGAANVGLALYFLAPGTLPDRAVEQAVNAGAGGVAEPLGDAPEVAQLISWRIDAAVLVGSR